MQHSEKQNKYINKIQITYNYTKCKLHIIFIYLNKYLHLFYCKLFLEFNYRLFLIYNCLQCFLFELIQLSMQRINFKKKFLYTYKSLLE